VVGRLKDLDKAASALGCGFNPFMTLAFLSLAVIPDLKLTDLGLVDVNRFELTGLFVDRDVSDSKGSK
jgi:adenine deaminase